MKMARACKQKFSKIKINHSKYGDRTRISNINQILFRK